MNKRQSGEYFENVAVEYLIEQGIEIIDRNVYCSKIGELDIIGLDRGASYGNTLVFFEVKYRKNEDYGYAASAVDFSKQKKIKRCAEYYMNYKKTNYWVRFDVIAIDGDKITWIKNAF